MASASGGSTTGGNVEDFGVGLETVVVLVDSEVSGSSLLLLLLTGESSISITFDFSSDESTFTFFARLKISKLRDAPSFVFGRFED